MRIMMISDHADPLAKIGSKESGGQNIYVMNIANLLASKGHVVDVYTRWDSPSKQEVVKVRKGFRVIRVAAGPKGYMPKDGFLKVIVDFVAGIKSRIELEGLSYDVIFSNYWFSGIIGLQLAKEYGLPQTHIYHSIGKIRYETLKDVHPEEVDRNLFRIRNVWEERIAKNSTSIITTSPVEQVDIQRIFGIDDKKIVCIPIGVDIQLFKPRRSKALREKLRLPTDKPVILYVGRIEWRKGIGTLIRALQHIPKAELFIVGGGANKASQKLDAAERQRLERIAKKLRISKRVHFLGAKSQTQAAQYYAAADVCAVPSYYEPFGIVPLEAMACGTPVVASKTGGLRFTINDGITGHLAKTKDHIDLAAKLTVVLDRGKGAYTTAARKHVERYFTWPKIAHDTATYLSSLLLMKGIAYEDSPGRASRGINPTESLRRDRAGSLQSL